ncbi:MAG: haloacid dehalogenase type II [Sphingomonadales bacterium]|nr:haloacid dehalogenase type II [Sphingomonadales bacterium]
MAQSESNRALPKALAFDVFGTVVDWRTSIAREVAPVLLRIGRSDVDCHDFADRWRARYLPALLASNKSESGFVKLDSLHRTMLDALLLELGVDENMLDDAARTDLVHAWHRLDPWPDSVAGLTRLKQRFPIVTLSNGNISLMINMARRAGLPWDAILGAEIAQAYKPARQAYLATAAALDIAPEELCLVAAHHGDLAAARSAGLMTAFIPRPLEYGGAPAPDLSYKQEWEFHADSLTGLADQLGC